MGDAGVIVETGTAAILRDLAQRRGLSGAVRAVAVALRQPAHDLVAGNVTRKRLRVPAVFGWRGVRGIYGWTKAVQARLLEVRLTAQLTDDPDLAALIYNGSNFPESVLAQVATDLGRTKLIVEGGFFPDSIQIDPRGVNAANSVPRDPAFYLDTAEDFAAAGLPALTKTRVVKAGGAAEVVLPNNYIFLAFQVPSDMQVTRHSPWITDMAAFYAEVQAAADRNPGLTFVIKEHPSFPLSVQGTQPSHPRVIFANGNVTRDLIEGAAGVVTLNSTVGLEAVFLERPAIILGDACYDIPGLVRRARDRAELDAALADLPGAIPDPVLRRQVLGWLWNRYLVHGSYASPPQDLAVVLECQLRLLETPGPRVAGAQTGTV
nr:nitrogen fixation protein FixF [Loktanella sp. M215]